MSININNFYESLYQSSFSTDKLIDSIYDFFWDDVKDNFELMDEVLLKINISKLPISIIICFLSCSFKYDSELKNYSDFYKRVVDDLKARGESEERIKNLLIGFESSNGYWKYMDALGIPEFITGIRPPKI
jgi:hypothetical protein